MRHPDLPTGYELIAVPPDGAPQLVCPLWPDCECAADCTAGSAPRRARRVFLALAFATLAIATGLILWSVHP